MELTARLKVGLFWKPGGILKGGQDDFVANEPGAYRFEDQWLEVVMSSSESTPYTLTETEINEILDGIESQ